MDLPPYFFRVRENGATVFRVRADGRSRRIEMEPIALANLRSGAVKPQGDRALSNADMAAIRDWMEGRRADLAAREVDDIERAIDHLNLVAEWAQRRATPEQLEAVTDRLLLTMHDLREVLVRKKADRLGGS